jgi:hypothetical protein
MYNFSEIKDFLPIYYTYIPGEKIDELQYNFYWNSEIFTYATFESILPQTKYEILIKSDYQLKNVIPVYNTKNIFILELCKKNCEEKIFLLFKDYKLFEFKLNDEFESITLDILTYKLYGLTIFNMFCNNVEYTLVETDKYFEKLM